MSLPVFKTKRLLLKGVTLDDVRSYEKHFIDYEVIRYLSAKVPWPYPPSGVAEFIKGYILPNQGKDQWVWGIFFKKNPTEIIGIVEVWREGTPENRGFWLGRKFWGQGIMSEAVRPVMNYAFSALGFKKMILANALGNTRSRRVKEKCGARLLRVEPAKFVDPALSLHEIWEVTEEDWKKHEASL